MTGLSFLDEPKDQVPKWGLDTAWLSRGSDSGRFLHVVEAGTALLQVGSLLIQPGLVPERVGPGFS